MAEKVAVAPHPVRLASEGAVAAGTPRHARPASDGRLLQGRLVLLDQPASEGAATPQPGLTTMGKVAARVLVHLVRRFAGVGLWKPCAPPARQVECGRL